MTQRTEPFDAVDIIRTKRDKGVLSPEQIDWAIDAYTRVLDRYPENIRALNNLALIYQDRRQFAKAESLMAKAASIDSKSP